LALFSQHKDFLANLKQMAKTIFGNFSLAKMGVVGLACLYQQGCSANKKV